VILFKAQRSICHLYSGSVSFQAPLISGALSEKSIRKRGKKFPSFHHFASPRHVLSKETTSAESATSSHRLHLVLRDSIARLLPIHNSPSSALQGPIGSQRSNTIFHPRQCNHALSIHPTSVFLEDTPCVQ